MKICTFLFLFFCLPFGLWAQTGEKEILAIYEDERYDSKNPSASQVRHRGIAEINATLLLKLDKDEIRRRMAEMSGVATEDLRFLESYKRIRLHLDSSQVLLREGLAASRRGEEPDFAKLSEVSRRMSELTSLIMDDPVLKAEGGKAFVEYKKKLDDGRIDRKAYTRNEYLLDYLTLKAESTLEQMERGSDSLRFMLAGSLHSRKSKPQPIHLGKKFDDNPVKTFVVPRWVFNVSESQKAELSQIAELSANMEQLRDKNTADLKNAFLNTFASRACVEEIETTLKTLPDNIEALGQQAKTRVDSLLAPQKTALDAVLSRYDKAQTGATDISGATESLLGFQSDIDGLSNSIDAFFSSFETSVAGLADSLKTLPQVKDALSLVQSCKQQVIEDKKQWAPLAQSFKDLFFGSANDKAFHTAITDKVKKLKYADIPAESRVDLTQSGRRTNGDKIVIEAFIGTQNEDPQPIFHQTFTVQQIALYSEAQVSLILANPEPDVKDQKHQFFFAPSYSVLFKWGSRKSHFYNDFLNIGLGANFSSPDFDYDGIPEFAAAATVTFVKDFFSLGYGYNFGQDAPYWFVGFRVPFAAAALPILNEVD